jgi:hypothetical protein
MRADPSNAAEQDDGEVVLNSEAPYRAAGGKRAVAFVALTLPPP